MGKDQDDRFYIGVDLGGTNIQAGLLRTDKNRLVARSKTKTRPEEGVGAVIQRVAQAVRDAAADAKVKVGDITAVGIGAPGAVAADAGVVLNAPNLRWNNVKLSRQLGNELAVPVLASSPGAVQER